MSQTTLCLLQVSPRSRRSRTPWGRHRSRDWLGQSESGLQIRPLLKAEGRRRRPIELIRALINGCLAKEGT